MRCEFGYPKMYYFLRDSFFLKIASELLKSSEISVHGIFNARPMFPDSKFLEAPWHQDSQYWKLDYGQKYDDPFKANVIINLYALSIFSLLTYILRCFFFGTGMSI